MNSIIYRALCFVLVFFGLQASAAEPTNCLKGELSSTGDQYYRSIVLKITNVCKSSVDLQDISITFQNNKNLNTSFWGDFGRLSYPDNELKITSQPSGGLFLSSLRLHFPSYFGSNSKLSPGQSIYLRYGAPTEGFVKGSVKFYLGGTAEAGSIKFTNVTPKPVDVTQEFVTAHVMLNGSKITDVQLPWQGSVTAAGLTPANYNLSVDNVADGRGGVYQGTVTPSSINLTTGQDAIASVSYQKIEQSASLGIKLEALPEGLKGYTGKPVVVINENGASSSITQEVNWNSSTVISQLKNNGSYSFSTPVINFNGLLWVPKFTPDTVVAKTTGLPTTTLSYQSSEIPKNNVVINVNGAPSDLSTLSVVLTPTIGALLNINISLVNGIGSGSLLLPDGESYKVSVEDILGYSVSFSPQPLVSKVNSVETITITQSQSGTPVALNGQLQVIGTQLCNEQGLPIQLKGMSSHGLQWYASCLTTESLKVLADDFKSSVFRIALYVQEGGYETDPEGFTQKVNALIKQVSDLGMYVIVDWHILSPGDPNFNFDRARKFFTDIAAANQGRKNMLYEICNEPNGVSWATIKGYADRLIPIIRAIDSNTVIIVGTPGWSSLGMSEGNGPQEIIKSPINFPNVMYAFHFYAASHRDEYLNAVDIASNSIPVFVTEFGMQTYDGDGANDFAMTDRYLDLFSRKKISWVNWNFSDDFRSGAIWKVGTCPNGPWTDANLKPSGIYIKQKIQE